MLIIYFNIKSHERNKNKYVLSKMANSSADNIESYVVKFLNQRKLSNSKTKRTIL